MNDQFDHNIRSRIYSFESDVPDHLWDAVDRQLRPKRNRRWWFLLLLPAIAASYWGLTATKTTAPGDVSDNQKIEELKRISFVSTPGKIVDKTKKIPLQSENQPSLIYASSPTTFSDKEISNKSSILMTPGLNSSKYLADDQSLTQENQSKDAEKTGLFDDQRTIAFNPDINHRQYLVEILPHLTQHVFYPEILLKDPKIDICPSFSSRLSIKPFAEFSVTGGLPYRSLVQKDQELMDYKSLRERTEKERSSFTVQGLIGVDIGDRFEIKTGLSTSRIYEVFDYIDESASRTVTNIITDTIIVNGVPQIRTDTSIVTQYGQRIKLSQNRYTTLDLPLLAGYKFKVQGHQFFLQAGAIYNLALWTKGDLLSPDEEIISIDSKDPSKSSVFKKRVGLDLSASLGYELELSEGNQLRILCSLRQSFGDFSAPQYPLSQRYKHLHLGVSWKHQF